MKIRSLIVIGLMLLQACASTTTLVAENTFLASDRTFTMKTEPGWMIASFKAKNSSMNLEKGKTILIAHTIKNVRASDENLIEFSAALSEEFAKQIRGGEFTQSKIQHTPGQNLRYVETTGDAVINNTSLLYTTFTIAGNNNLYLMVIMGPEESYINNQSMVAKVPAGFLEK